MLYELYLLFDINLFKYISVRALGGFLVSLFVCLFLMPRFIAWAKIKLQQPINKYVEGHKSKSKTPTMGGVIFVGSTLLASLLTVDLSNEWVWVALLTIVLFTLVGLMDDLQKIFTGDNLLGLSAGVKFVAQSIFAVVIATMLYSFGFMTELYVPFYKYPLFDMGVWCIPFWSFIIVSTCNAVNITDGLDGLATFPSFLAFLTLSVFVYLIGNAIYSEYLLLPTFIGVGEVCIIAACFAGSLLGFLWFNAYPAEIFMGDSGSLPIGAFMAYLAILGKSEVLLILIGFVFVMETVSVMMQVFSFKVRKKRVFLMAPLHHHFEMKGWGESKIIIRFWVISLIVNLVAILTLKFR